MKFLDTYGIIGDLSPSLGEFIDERDGKKYNTVKIRDMEWFRDNLDFDNSDFYGDGGRDVMSMFDLPEASQKHHRKDCGRLYSPISAENACPSGWGIPSKYDWLNLIESILGKKTENLDKKDSYRIYNKLFGNNSLLKLASCGRYTTRWGKGTISGDYVRGEYYSIDNNKLIIIDFEKSGIFKFDQTEINGGYAIRPIRKK